MPQPARGFCAAAQSAVWAVLSRSSTSLAEPTPPASRSLLVNTDQLIAMIVAVMPRAAMNPLRYPFASSAPMMSTTAPLSQAARVWVR